MGFRVFRSLLLGNNSSTGASTSSNSNSNRRKRRTTFDSRFSSCDSVDPFDIFGLSNKKIKPCEPRQLSIMNQLIPLRNVAFKFYQCSENKAPFKREVHGPRRPPRSSKYRVLGMSGGGGENVVVSEMFGSYDEKCGVESGGGVSGRESLVDKRLNENYEKLRREAVDCCGVVVGSQLNEGYRRSKSEAFDCCEVGSKLYEKYGKSMIEAVDCFRYVEKGKEVIDVDDYEEEEREIVQNDDVEDSSIEEVEVVGNGKERWREKYNEKLTELDGKIKEWKAQRSCSSVVSEELTHDILKSKSAGKVLEVVSRNKETGVPSVPLYKQLHLSADKRSMSLRRLKFDIQLKLEHLSIHRSHRAAKKKEKDAVTEPFVPLTNEEEAEVNLALSNSKRLTVLVTHKNSNIVITGEVLQCLRPGGWLNDEVINLYFELLKEREGREPHKFLLRCHFFNTFFYKKLIGGTSGYDFKSVKRWTTQRRLGYCLLDCDKIFVPVHKGKHWCLAVINKRDEKFQYLDSLRGVDKQVMKILARYYVDEVKDKSGKEIDVSSWKQEHVEDLPAQMNGFDCGMFMIKYADFYSRDVGLCFDQEHMPYFRQRTAKEILRLKAE